MFLKTLILMSVFSTSPLVLAATRNLCDDLIEGGKSTTEQINKCHVKFGQSEHFKEQEQKKKWQDDSAKAAAEVEKKNKDNVEFKKFSAVELEDAGFGKPFYAIKVDYKNPYKPKERRITDGNALCKYLGFEKAVKSIVSAEIHPDNADKNGLVVDTNFLGIVSDTPELYVDKDLKFTVRKYVELTCVKVKNKTETTPDLLKEVAEDLVVLNVELNAGKKDSSAAIDNGPRKPAGDGKTTPNGYKKPEWAQESKTVTK